MINSLLSFANPKGIGPISPKNENLTLFSWPKNMLLMIMMIPIKMTIKPMFIISAWFIFVIITQLFNNFAINFLNNKLIFLFMDHSLKVGFSFGLTSGVITTLGLMVGLYSSTHSKLAVLGGILTIAIADAFSDALGIHVSEESENKHTTKQIWTSTTSTFLSKFIFSLTFVIPVLVFELSTAIIVSIIWGLSLLSIFSFKIAKEQKAKPFRVISEHLAIALVVILITNYVGKWISVIFGI